MARYRIMLVNGGYFPQYRFLWLWFNYHEAHPGGITSPAQFYKLDDAIEYVYQDMSKVRKAFRKKTKSVEVWSHD